MERFVYQRGRFFRGESALARLHWRLHQEGQHLQLSTFTDCHFEQWRSLDVLIYRLSG